MARATTNKFDEDSIRRICESALTLARLQPPDPEMLPMPGPQTYGATDRYFKETADFGPHARAEIVQQAIARAEKDHLTTAGICSSGVSASALLNSRGLSAYHQETLSEFSVTMMLDDTSSGWAKKTSPKLCRAGAGKPGGPRRAQSSGKPRATRNCAG